ncbi:hypothetical protein FGK63_01910 [Ruegeria sediminis]|uniref:Uncharacterized protein n=1 Tax=Ruegeria sediminis TaxID=2583820 RepID=A0ABY2X4F7_9RHOB|nr:hypothetical protein [Ruegeria sediminis]TMV09849.1 hypothetical protein FGK63_01910 [Ruegeria sediminis]
MERERIWNLARVMGQFTAHDLSADSGRSVQFCKDRIGDWILLGYVEELPERRGNKKQFKITGKSGMPPATDRDGNRIREEGSPEGNMWRAIRMLRTFSPRDVAMHANTETVPVAEAEAVEYCRVLAKGGYLRIEVKAIAGRRPATYRLMRNTGPLPPRVTRIRAIRDDNLGQVTYAQGILK